MSQINELGFIHAPKIYVVCNRPDTAAIWASILREKGLTVIFESSPQKALDCWSEEIPNLVVIDVDAENQAMVEICKEFREICGTPILLLLQTHNETTILDAYNVGVDDVIVKPISPAVFQAKIMVWVRHSWTVPVEGLNLIHSGRHRLDPMKRCLIDPMGREVKLTNLEFNLLHLLMSRHGQVFSADDLIHSIWGAYGVGDHILLKNVVYRLRKKIEMDQKKPVFLVTELKGYSFQG